MTADGNDLDLLDQLIAKAKAAGADAADALFERSVSLAYAQRLGTLERLEREENSELGLRVLIGRRQAVVSSNDTSAQALDDLVERALAMARVVPEDPYCGLAGPDQLALEPPELEICDDLEPATETLIERAADCEAAAREVEGITNSEGAEASWARSGFAMVGSNGFAGRYSRSHHTLVVSVVAGSGVEMERDYEFSSCVYGEDLDPPAEIGRRAAERTVRRLGARKATTGQVPVVFDPRVSGSLLGHLSRAINGTEVARGTSFLKDQMEQQIFAKGIVVVDDPHRARGLRSRPFDDEGLINRRCLVVSDGRLATWLLDLASARQLNLTSTGHASRSTAGTPHPASSNLYLEPGSQTPAALIGDIEAGFYVTEMMGMGVNGVTGDYSRGAAGFWIDRGELAYPVSEVTVAGNLKDMFPKLTPADDLEFRYATNAPTVRVDGMTVAGA